MNRSFTHLALITFIGGVLGRGLRYIINVVIARGLGPEALGIFAFGLVILQSGAVFSRVGLDNAVVKFIPEYKEDGDYHRLVATLHICLLTPLVIGFFVALGLYLHLSFLSQLFDGEFTDAAKLFLFGIPLYSTMFVSMSATRAFKQTKWAVYIRDIGQSGVALIFVTLGAFVLSDLFAIIVGYLVSIIVGVFIGVFSLRKLVPKVRPAFSWSETRRLFVFSIPVTLIAVSQFFITWTDIVMLSIFLDSRNVGLYQAAYQTSVLLLVVLQAANSVFPTLVSEFQHTEDIKSLETLYIGVTKWVTYLTIIGLVFLLVFNREVLFLFNTTSEAARQALIVLAVGQTISAVTGSVGFLLTMSGYERIESINTIFISLLNVILNYFFIIRFGMIGAAIATAISLAAVNIVRIVEVKLLLGIDPFHRSYLFGIPSLAVCFSVIFGGKTLIPSSLPMAVSVGALSLIVFGATYAFIGLDDLDKSLINSL